MRFSIITPSFKQLDWLRLNVASVRDQIEGAPEHFEIQHIIQDGGSEGIDLFAREIGAEFYEDGHLVFGRPEKSGTADRYRVSIYRERDRGMYDAINKGLSKADGELCAYLNCDEQYLPLALWTVAEWFQAHPASLVVFADAILLDAEGLALSYRRTVLPDRWHTRLCHLNVLTCSTFFRQSVIERKFLFPENKKIIGDALWVDALLAAKIRMGYLYQATSTFTFTGANLSELDRGADSEQAKWQREAGSPPLWCRPVVSLIHRVRKLLVGAYRARDLRYSIITRKSLPKREAIECIGVSHGWPTLEV